MSMTTKQSDVIHPQVTSFPQWDAVLQRAIKTVMASDESAITRSSILGHFAILLSLQTKTAYSTTPDITAITKTHTKTVLPALHRLEALELVVAARKPNTISNDGRGYYFLWSIHPKLVAAAKRDLLK